jgi:hypothetical protein
VNECKRRFPFLSSVGFCLLVSLGWSALAPKPAEIRRTSPRLRRRSPKRRDSWSTDSSDDGRQSRRRRQRHLAPGLRSSAALFLVVVVVAAFAAKTWTKNQDWLSRASLFR